jgi:hypothetical protein
MGRIDRLAERYRRYIGLPWQRNLAGAQRAIFVVYDKSDERRLRVRKESFALATRASGHGWSELDLTTTFAEWMMSSEYRESYFEAPETLALKLDQDFLAHVGERIRSALTAPGVDEEAVVAIFGIASLFGFLRVSEVMKAAERHIRGRIAVFFPGEYENSNYRLLDARDGWNYLAVPITLAEDRGVYET